MAHHKLSYFIRMTLRVWLVAGFTVNGDILRNDRNFFVINLVSSSPLTSRHLDVYYNVRHIKT